MQPLDATSQGSSNIRIGNGVPEGSCVVEKLNDGKKRVTINDKNTPGEIRICKISSNANLNYFTEESIKKVEKLLELFKDKIPSVLPKTEDDYQKYRRFPESLTLKKDVEFTIGYMFFNDNDYREYIKINNLHLPERSKVKAIKVFFVGEKLLKTIILPPAPIVIDPEKINGKPIGEYVIKA